MPKRPKSYKTIFCDFLRLELIFAYPVMLPQISQQEAVDERDRLRLLLEINNAVVSNLSLKELLLAVSNCLREFFAHDWASMVIKDEESGQLRVHALDAPAPGGVLEEGSILPLDGTPPGIAMATRQTVLRDRIDFNEFYSPIIREAYNAGLRCGCSVPLISHDEVLGTINVGSLREAAFTRRDAELLEQIAGQVAIAVENTLNFQRAKRERDHNQLMLEVNNAVTSHLDIRKLLAATSDCLKRIIPHDVFAMASKRSLGRARVSRRSCNKWRQLRRRIRPSCFVVRRARARS